MPESLATAVLPAGPDTVWPLIRDFNGLPAWHPAIAASELEGDGTPGVGAIRRLTLADGAEVREVLIALDDADRHLTYGILTSPFPVERYRSTIRVVPVTATGESFVEWSLEFDCDPADSERLSAMFADDVFATGLRGLASYSTSDE